MKLKDMLRKWGSASFFSWLSSYFNDSLTFVKREFSLRRLRVIIDPKGSMCYTNGLLIVLGMLCAPMLDETLTKAERIEILKGILWHEIGHVLFTPFSADRIVYASMMSGRLWPTEPENIPESLRKYMAKGNKERKRVFDLYEEVSNCLEDGRIENLLLIVLYHFRGFARALIAVREYSRKSANVKGTFIAESIREFREDPENPARVEGAYHAATASVFWLSKYGDIPEMEALKEDRMFALAIRRIAPHIALAVDSVNDAPLFYRELNYVFCEMWPYFLPYLESLPEDTEAKGREVATAAGAMSGVSSAKPSDPRGEAEAASKGAKVKAARKKAARAAARAEAAEEEPGGTTSSTEPSAELEEAASTDEDASKGEAEAEAKDPEKEDSSESNPETGAEDESESELSVEFTAEEPDETESEETEEENSEENSDEEAEDGIAEDDAASEADDDLSDIEELSPWAENPEETLYEDDDRESKGLDPEMEIGDFEKSPSSLSSEEEAELDESLAEPTGIDYGSENRGISWRIRRAKQVERDDLTYNTYEKYIKVGKVAAKKLKAYLDPEKEPCWEKDLYYGPKLITARLSNPNMKHWARKAKKERRPKLTVCILVDESGSMMGRNIEAAKAAVIALFEMCRALGIRFGVFGHTCYDPQVQMTCYVPFGSNDPMDRYRLLKISAQRNNRDGAALRYCAELLSKEQTDRKLLIIISDGQPAAHGYHGEPAKRDIQKVLADFEHKGVKFIAAAIDSDKAAIEDIYGTQRFLDITNLEMLPTKLAALVRKATL